MSMFSRFFGVSFIAVAAFSSGACSTQHPTYAPDGRRSYVITCNGVLNNYSSCLVKAGRACGPHGYDTLKESSEEDRTLFISCKLPEAH